MSSEKKAKIRRRGGEAIAIEDLNRKGWPKKYYLGFLILYNYLKSTNCIADVRLKIHPNAFSPIPLFKWASLLD